MMPSTTISQRMQAFVLKAYGGPEHTALEEVPVPSPGARQLSARFEMNPADEDIWGHDEAQEITL